MESFIKKLDLTRHSRCSEHQAAEEAWQKRLLADACEPAAAAPAQYDAVSIRTLQPTICDRAVVAARALLETAGSFHSYDVLLDALVGEDRQTLESHWHLKRLVSTMVVYEKELTHRLLREGAGVRLQADGFDRTYQVEIGTVLWSLPFPLKHLPTDGEPS